MKRKPYPSDVTDEAWALEAIAPDPRELLRVAAGRKPRPSAAILDSRMLQSTLASGARAADDGAKRREGSKSTRRLLRSVTCWSCA
jgi:hypothetical protein